MNTKEKLQQIQSAKETYLSNFTTNMPADFLDRLIYALKVIQDYHEEVNYLSFNGGKDCLAVFLLFKLWNEVTSCMKVEELDHRNVIQFLSKAKLSRNNSNIRFLYFVNCQHFTEEENYVFDLIKNEGVETLYLNSDFIAGIYFLKSRFPEINNIYMGIRLIDLPPNKQSSTTVIEKSTSPYPNFNRIYPILNWNYEDVWRLILLMDYPYLSLYDKGYTSIGKINDTKTNQTLSLGEQLFLPAFCLTQLETEREFRYK